MRRPMWCRCKYQFWVVFDFQFRKHAKSWLRRYCVVAFIYMIYFRFWRGRGLSVKMYAMSGAIDKIHWIYNREIASIWHFVCVSLFAGIKIKRWARMRWIDYFRLLWRGNSMQFNYINSIERSDWPYILIQILSHGIKINRRRCRRHALKYRISLFPLFVSFFIAAPRRVSLSFFHLQMNA